MKKIILISCILMISSFSALAVTNPTEERAIIVSGSGTVQAAPDVAYVSLGVAHEKKTAKEAQASVNQTMSSVLAALDKIPLAKDKIKTTRINLSPRYDYDRGKRTFKGFMASNELKITLDDLSLIGKCIDTALNAGANDINYVSFALKEQETFKNEALKKAFANAKAKAESLAKASGTKLSKLIAIQESTADLVIPRGRMVKAKAAPLEGDSGSTPVAPGEIEVRGSLTAVFELH